MAHKHPDMWSQLRASPPPPSDVFACAQGKPGIQGLSLHELITPTDRSRSGASEDAAVDGRIPVEPVQTHASWLATKTGRGNTSQTGPSRVRAPETGQAGSSAAEAIHPAPPKSARRQSKPAAAEGNEIPPPRSLGPPATPCKSSPAEAKPKLSVDPERRPFAQPPPLSSACARRLRRPLRRRSSTSATADFATSACSQNRSTTCCNCSYSGAASSAQACHDARWGFCPTPGESRGRIQTGGSCGPDSRSATGTCSAQSRRNAAGRPGGDTR